METLAVPDVPFKKPSTTRKSFADFISAGVYGSTHAIISISAKINVARVRLIRHFINLEYWPVFRLHIGAAEDLLAVSTFFVGNAIAVNRRSYLLNVKLVGFDVEELVEEKQSPLTIEVEWIHDPKISRHLEETEILYLLLHESSAEITEHTLLIVIVVVNITEYSSGDRIEQTAERLGALPYLLPIFIFRFRDRILPDRHPVMMR